MKRPNKLSEHFVKNVARRGRYGDRAAPGLSLLVRATTSGGWSKSWCQRLKVDGKEAHLGLGSFPKVTLKLARAKAIENAHRANRGERVRPRKSVPTFKEATEQYFQNRRDAWKAGTRYADQWMAAMRIHTFRRLGRMPVDAITARDVLQVLEWIWKDYHPTAKVVRQRICGVFDWCLAHEYVAENVADKRIDDALPPGSSRPTHHLSLPYREVPNALAAVADCAEATAVRLCFRFLVLTAARSGEATGARWSEIDTVKRIWRVPGGRVKNRVEHRQPLSAPALDVLKQARQLWDGSDLVFPSPLRAGTVIRDQALRDVLITVNLDDRASIHGFRRSFRTWASECTDADFAVMELALSHTVGSEVERAYNRTDLLEKRRDLMETWGAYACGPGETSAHEHRHSEE